MGGCGWVATPPASAVAFSRWGTRGARPFPRTHSPRLACHDHAGLPGLGWVERDIWARWATAPLAAVPHSAPRPKEKMGFPDSRVNLYALVERSAYVRDR